MKYLRALTPITIILAALLLLYSSYITTSKPNIIQQYSIQTNTGKYIISVSCSTNTYIVIQDFIFKDTTDIIYNTNMYITVITSNNTVLDVYTN